MEIIEQSVESIDTLDSDFYISVVDKIERAARTCYKSEEKQTSTSYINFIKNLIKSGHESVLEHANITLKWITDRGVSHELVRHRIASYSQESTRYCNYEKKGIQFIKPVDFELSDRVIDCLESIVWNYENMLRNGRTPQQARAILPNCLKTEIVLTMNIREWRHMLKLRTSKAAHPQMRDMAIKTLNLLHANLPILFDDIEVA